MPGTMCPRKAMTSVIRFTKAGECPWVGCSNAGGRDPKSPRRKGQPRRSRPISKGKTTLFIEQLEVRSLLSVTVTGPTKPLLVEGTAASINLGSFTDPGVSGPWNVVVNWGDGSTNTTFSAVSGHADSPDAHLRA